MTLATFVRTPPPADRGRLIGLDDWRLCVEIALPSGDPSSLVGVGTVGTMIVTSGLTWHDVTPWVRGLTWSRGADQPFGRPRVGEATITLASPGWLWSPLNWVDAYEGANLRFGPGTIMRVVAHSPTAVSWWDASPMGFQPQFTGEVRTWVDGSAGLEADRWETITLVETAARLAAVDDPVLALAEGASEPAGDRLRRLADTASWPYGYDGGAGAGYPLIETIMEGNRLAELYLAADSGGLPVFTDRSGRLRMHRESAGNAMVPAVASYPWYDLCAAKVVLSTLRDPGITGAGQTGTVLTASYDTDSLTPANDLDTIINKRSYARVGGAPQLAVIESSVNRYGPRSESPRDDLQTVTDANVAALAADRLDRTARSGQRVEGLTIDANRPEGRAEALRVLLAADITDLCTIGITRHKETGLELAVTAAIRAYTHRVTPTSTSLSWSADFEFDTINIPYEET